MKKGYVFWHGKQLALLFLEPDKRKQLEPFGKDSSCLLFFDEDAPMGCCFFFIRIRILRFSQF